MLFFCACIGEVALASVPAEQLVVTKGKLPETGRVVIRSELGWLREDAPLFASVARGVREELSERGLTVVSASPSESAPPPEGIESVRGVRVPEHKGGPRRIMSVAEAISRMKAMQLAREGRLPQATFEGGAAGVRKSSGSSVLPLLTPQEMIRFALSQEEGRPELRGHVTIPGRLPEELRSGDANVADYAVTVRFSMLWPASSVPDSSTVPNTGHGLAVGWHLLEMACYDLVPVREGRAPRRIWNATVQRVAFGTYLGGTLPRMARDAVDAP